METILQLCQVTTNDWPHHKANSSKGNQMTLHFQLIHRMCHICQQCPAQCLCVFQ